VIRVVHGNVKQQVLWGPIAWLLMGWDMLRGYTNTLYVKPNAKVRVVQVKRRSGYYMIFEVKQ
jgi:hypothetical protein